jgi:hypothetical protein
MMGQNNTGNNSTCGESAGGGQGPYLLIADDLDI